VTTSGPPSRFDLDTAVTQVRDGVFDARIDQGWWIERGPNGGYVAAILTQALIAHVGDPGRHARSITIHYLAPAVEGPARVEVRTERAGRTVQYLSARMVQGERVVATVQSAFATMLGGTPTFADATFPGYPPPEEVERQPDPPVVVPMRRRYEFRRVTGAPWEGPARSAESGGWIRLVEPRPYDAALVAAISDAWYPAVFNRIEPMGVPTVDLTLHVRSVEALARMCPEDWMAVRFRTTVVAEGFLEEDGELWSPDGTLVAHSRQLGMLLPR
jgi:acyl-CoA thioesterase